MYDWIEQSKLYARFTLCQKISLLLFDIKNYFLTAFLDRLAWSVLKSNIMS